MADGDEHEHVLQCMLDAQIIASALDKTNRSFYLGQAETIRKIRAAHALDDMQDALETAKENHCFTEDEYNKLISVVNEYKPKLENRLTVKPEDIDAYEEAFNGAFLELI